MQELTTPFEQHDLVWAKIQNYPWWPGKIIEIFEQKKSLFFKISFYADPTYCYLKQEALIPFEEFRSQLNANFSIDSQLQKAIGLANNAFQRKKQTIENRRLEKQAESINEPEVQHLQSQIIEEQPSKGEEFQQSTIHIDFEAQNSNGKIDKQKKATQIKNLLQKYKLDRIPKLCKQQKIEVEEEPSSEGNVSVTESDEQEKVELFDLKNTLRRKNIKKNNKRKPMIRRKRITSFSDQQRKIQFMKRLCSLLISKGFDSQISRQITVKLIEKTEQVVQKLNDTQIQKITIQGIYVKFIAIVSNIDAASSYDDKLLEVFTSADAFLYQYCSHEKEEQEKTNLAYVLQEELQVMC